MIQIHLEQLQFFAYHGLYQEERLIGNEFLIDIHLEYQPSQKIVHSIHETVDYTKVYEMIDQRMRIPSDLLETIATEFCYQILNEFPLVNMIQCNIKKMNPPINQFSGTVGVSYCLKRSEL